MFADHREPIADLAPVTPGQALNLLGEVVPIQRVGGAVPQQPGLGLGPLVEVGVVEVAHAIHSVHRRVRVVVLVSLGRVLLLLHFGALAQHLQELRPELLLVRLAAVRRDGREMPIDFRIDEATETFYQVVEDSHSGAKAKRIREGILRGTTQPVTAAASKR